MELEEIDRSRKELLANIQRLNNILLETIRRRSQGEPLNAKEARLLALLQSRTQKLWTKVSNNHDKEVRRDCWIRRKRGPESTRQIGRHSRL